MPKSTIPHIVMIGGLTPETCHSEIEVSSVEEAIVYLHTMARKVIPEPAIADIGDYRTWVSNENLEHVDLNAFPLTKDKVHRMVARENEKDQDAMRENNVFIPDIKIVPISAETACVTSDAMQCETYVGWYNLEKTLHELISEYRELIEAGEISVPIFKKELAS